MLKMEEVLMDNLNLAIGPKPSHTGNNFYCHHLNDNE